MRRIRIVCVALVAAVALLASEPDSQRAAAAAPDSLGRFEFARSEMGVLFRVVLYAQDDESARRASDAAFERVKQLNALLSDYDAKSEINRLTAAGPTDDGVAVSAELWSLLNRAHRLSEETDGAFDVTVGPYSRLWRRARRQRELPSAERLAEAKAAVGFRYLELVEPTEGKESKTGKVRVRQANMQLDLGGIAKGYAADEALAVLRKLGIRHAMVAAAGDIAVGDAPPSEVGWRIGVARLGAESEEPGVYLRLANCGVSTSGDAFQHVEIDGKRYSHIVDPRTGIGLTERSSVTVVAPDATTADSLATAMSVIGEQQAQRLLEKYPRAEMLFVRNENEKAVATRSAGFERYVEIDDANRRSK
ncbi:MAG: FAD:protein FMN transferase [Pirellulales bacterium]